MTQKRKFRRWLPWLAVLAWMAVIFYFSAQSGENSGSMSNGVTEALLSITVPGWDTMAPPEQEGFRDIAHLLVRKAAHMTEFAVLGGLLMNAFVCWFGNLTRWQAVLSLLCGVLYAASDEIHQAFVPARGPAVTDVLIDTAGVLIGVLLVWGIRASVKRRCKTSNTN